MQASTVQDPAAALPGSYDSSRVQPVSPSASAAQLRNAAGTDTETGDNLLAAAKRDEEVDSSTPSPSDGAASSLEARAMRRMKRAASSEQRAGDDGEVGCWYCAMY